MKKRDYYEVLGVSRDAPEADIKKAYRRLARKLHPDVNPGDKNAQKKFQEVQEAYDVLREQDKRRAYDRFGHSGPSMGFDPAAGGRQERRGPSPPPGGGSSFEGFQFDPADLGDIFGNLFGGGGARGRAREQGEDASGSLEIPFRDAILGGFASLSLRREKECARCEGKGRIGRELCPVCRGSGRVAEAETVKIRIPEGTENGGTIRIPGKGSEGSRGGASGDLYVTVRVAPHPYFERLGDDIHGIVPVTIKEAYAGAEIDVPTVHGLRRARIPAGSQGRQKFRLRGQGVKNPRTGQTGDHLYTIRIMLPRTETPAGIDAATLLDSLYEKPVRAELPKGL